MASAPLPPQFKPIQHYLKTAAEHDKRDPVVAYYCTYIYSTIVTISEFALVNRSVDESTLDDQDSCFGGKISPFAGWGMRFTAYGFLSNTSI